MKPIQINKKWFIPFLGLVIIFSFVFLYTNQDQKINQQAASAAGWFNYDWGWRTEITIDADQVPNSDQTDFPVVINSINAAWKTTGNGGYAGQSDGGDFVFTSSNGTTQLSHEIEKYDETTGGLIAWVKIPTLSHLADTIIYVYYGNDSCDDQWETDGSTWSNNFQGVWHLDEDLAGSAGTAIYTDSTANANHAKDYVENTGKDGKIGLGQQYELDTTDYALIPNLQNYIHSIYNTPKSLSIWFKTSSTSQQDIFARRPGGAQNFTILALNQSGQVAGSIQFNQRGYVLGSPGTIKYFYIQSYQANTINDGNWHHLVASFDAANTQGKLYLDGNDITTSVGNSGITDQASDAFDTGLGAQNKYDSVLNYLDGNLDELQLYEDTQLTEDWVDTMYNNQNAPETFYTIGSDEQGDTTPPTNPTSTDGYATVAKETELTSGNWYNYTAPYFEWFGAADVESGLSGYYVYWGTDSEATPVDDGAFQEGASYTVSSDLTVGETYHLIVQTKNNSGINNTADPTTLFTYSYENIAPTLPEYINVTPVGCSTSASFTFTWPAATDTGGSSLAGYQYRRGSTGSIQSVDALTLSTTSYQEGDNILYVRSIDNAGNVSSWQTSVYCSTATVQVVDGPTVSAGPSSITVDWVSNKATTGYVKVYEGNTYISEQGLTNFSLAHSVKVIGLEPEKAYRYQITWTDQSGNLGETDWYETSTATAPQINNLKVEVLSPTTLNVSWSSTISARFSLEYGIGNYGTIIASGDYLTGYSSKISDLVAGSTYQFRVNATGEDGTKFFAGESVLMPPLPSIGNLRFEPIKDRPDTAVKVSWDTNVELTSSVYYGLKGDSKKEISKSDKVKNHEIVVGELSDNSEYEIYAAGIDQYGNVARSNIQTLRTEYDSRPPKIDNISTESSNVASGKTDTAQITVGYTTDEPARCFVDYGIGISGENYSGKTTLDEILQTNHISVLSNLTPQSPYHFKISCSDKAGNQSESADQTVISGEITPSVFNIILKTLNSLFGWLGKVVD